ncbi:uncharacterized protein HMPREF1541_04255 [Cyphellophora europaea CBS 101466]|uniref:Bacteriophage T5 Orf172 DNA-binding domain-containing protein n=1 Tax=Cyphellophora europaea (strain CBS 101466) TaxID=1220924 RepID=W2RUK0_CYPE1|nr:uncharacterized protein HMPREF1541_04255 [Cyphellophora europaea CBS 101466]ETN39980.1 hypothetical protein HMPREF1541_04255 [Cyphellophora europaea CBS 101466]
MEVNGYIIPPPMETPQCIKVLTTSPQKNRHPRRCGCRTSQEDLKQAGWLTSELMRQTAEEKPTTIERIILLRVCRNTHRQILKVADQSATLKSLVQAYKESCPDLSPYQTMPRLEEELFEPYRTRSRTNSVQHLLPLKINQEQYKWGWIYIFDWPRAPGFLKIGYAKASAEKRTDKWGLCHPESTLLYHVELAFPERMEKLIHAELADQRHRLRDICSRCKEKHTEWFAVTIEKAQRIARDWSTVAASPLYMEDRTLTQQWVSRCVTAARDIIKIFEY